MIWVYAILGQSGLTKLACWVFPALKRPLLLFFLFAALPQASEAGATAEVNGYSISLSGSMIVYSASGAVVSTDEWTVKVDVKDNDVWSIRPSYLGDASLRSVREKTLIRLENSYAILNEFEPTAYHAFISRDSAMLDAPLVCFLSWVGYIPKSSDPVEDITTFRYGLRDEFGSVLDKGSYLKLSETPFGNAQCREFVMMLDEEGRGAAERPMFSVSVSPIEYRDSPTPWIAGHLLIDKEIESHGLRFPKLLKYSRYRLGRDSSGKVVSTGKPLVNFTLQCFEIQVPNEVNPSEIQIVGKVFVDDKRFSGLVENAVPYILTNSFLLPADSRYVKSALDRQRLEENKPTMGQLKFRNAVMFLSICLSLVVFHFILTKMNRKTKHL